MTACVGAPRRSYARRIVNAAREPHAILVDPPAQSVRSTWRSSGFSEGRLQPKCIVAAPCRRPALRCSPSRSTWVQRPTRRRSEMPSTRSLPLGAVSAASSEGAAERAGPRCRSARSDRPRRDGHEFAFRISSSFSGAASQAARDPWSESRSCQRAKPAPAPRTFLSDDVNGAGPSNAYRASPRSALPRSTPRCRRLRERELSYDVDQRVDRPCASASVGASGTTGASPTRLVVGSPVVGSKSRLRRDRTVGAQHGTATTPRSCEMDTTAALGSFRP